MKVEYKGVIIESLQGNIAAQPDMEAVVNAANAQLRRGGGVAGAIHRAAGPELEKAAVKLAPIIPGQAVITAAFNLPNKYVIHCLGPVYGVNHPEAELLASCYRNALKVAEQYKISSIAFPAISTGVFAYPAEKAAEVAVTALKAEIPALNYIKHIRFVLFDMITLRIFEDLLG